MASIEDIRTSIINDPRNARFTAEGWKPVFSAPSTAVITIVGQTPSADAQRSGLCWDDRSGDRLRSGIYLVFASVDNGGEGIVAKFAVVR